MNVRFALPLPLLFTALAGSACAQPSVEQVPMRDGVLLATDVYLPPGEGPFPTLLRRTPYGREMGAQAAANYTQFGIAVVIQDLRGRFDSEGVDGVYTTDGDGELKDGYDTVEWIASRGWSDGLVAMTGASALGITQYMAASAAPPALVMIDATVATPNLYSDAIFQGGVRRYALSHNWLEGQGSLHFEQEMVNHPYEDGFWDSVQTHDQYGAVQAAGRHTGGWFDIFGQGTIDAWKGYQEQGAEGAAGRQKLIMGPWAHGTLHTRGAGDLSFPGGAEREPYADSFNVMLNEALQVAHPSISDVTDDVPAVQYYVMGDVDAPEGPGNTWRTADTWPPEAAPVRLHLQDGGGLAEACPQGTGATSYVADPLDPTPTICGANLTIAAGSCDQREVEARDDVVVFETPALDSPLEVTGRVRAHLFVDIDTPDADLMVRLTDVYPDGRSMLIADGALRLAAWGSTIGVEPLQPGEVVEGVVDLWSTSVVFNAGHRLRISVASSNYPRFSVSLHNGLDYPASVEGESAGPATVTLHHSAGRASYIELPDPTRDPQDYVQCASAARGDDDDSAGDEAGEEPGCSCSAAADGAGWGWLLIPLVVGLRRRPAPPCAPRHPCPAARRRS